MVGPVWLSLLSQKSTELLVNFYLNHGRYCILDELHFDTNLGVPWEVAKDSMKRNDRETGMGLKSIECWMESASSSQVGQAIKAKQRALYINTFVPKRLFGGSGWGDRVRKIRRLYR
jgi:hypothetical protein